MPKHEQIENLNWIAGQLMSAACVSEGSFSVKSTLNIRMHVNYTYDLGVFYL